MENILLQQKLNNVLDSIAQIDNSITNKFKFMVGDYSSILCDLLLQTAFSQKVAIFGFEKTFINVAKKFKELLLEKNIISMDYLFSKEEKLSVENLSKLFLLPDDVRAIIVIDSSLVKIAGFYATIKNLPLYIVSCGLDVGESIESAFYLKNDNEYKVFETTCKKYFIIDPSLSNSLNIFQATAFDYIVNNIVSLIDEKINMFFTKELFSAKLYNKKNRAVIDAFSIMKYPPQERNSILVENCVICGLVNSIYGQEYLQINSLEGVRLLLVKEGVLDKSTLLAFTIKIIQLYAILCKKECQNLFLINDYNYIAEEISNILNINEKEVLDNLLEKKEKLDKSLICHNQFVNRFEKEIVPLGKSIESAKSIHLALNGKDINKEISCKDMRNIFRLAGGYSKKITGLSQILLYGINKMF